MEYEILCIFEIVDKCPPLTICSKIIASDLGGRSSQSIAATLIDENASCFESNEYYNKSFLIACNTQVEWWVTQFSNKPSSAKLVYQKALHEIGHVLGMTHVESNDLLMWPKSDL